MAGFLLIIDYADWDKDFTDFLLHGCFFVCKAQALEKESNLQL